MLRTSCVTGLDLLCTPSESFNLPFLKFFTRFSVFSFLPPGTIVLLCWMRLIKVWWEFFFALTIV